MKVRWSAVINGDEMIPGNQEFADMLRMAVGERESALICAGVSRDSIAVDGFMPRKAANIASVGGTFAMNGMSWGAPALVRPAEMEAGSVVDIL